MKKTVIITGASGGIGSACARVFAAQGWNTVIHANKNIHTAEKLAEELYFFDYTAKAFAADLTDREQAEKLVDFTLSEFGHIDALVNNAGAALPQKLFADSFSVDAKFIFNSNVLTCINASKAVIPHMVTRHSGSIVNVSSIWGSVGGSCEALYSSSKAAVIGLTKALAKELGPSEIRVNCVCPGVIETKMNSHLSEEDFYALCQQTALCRIGSAEEVAKAIYFLAGDDASFITGQTLGVDGGFIG